MQSELSGNQHQLLRAFDQLAAGSSTIDVTASDAAQEADFDPGSRKFEAALDYLVDVGYLVPTGDERESVQDHGGRHQRGAAATTALGRAVAHSRQNALAGVSSVWPRPGYKIEATVGPPVRVPTGAVVWRTDPATVRCVKGAACYRRRARSGSTSAAPRREGTARAGERLGARP